MRLVPAALLALCAMPAYAEVPSSGASGRGAPAEVAAVDGIDAESVDTEGAQTGDIGTRDMGALEDLKRSPKEAVITDKLGNKVPTDVRLTDHDGREVTLADYLHEDKALVLVMGYYQCPMLCSLVLNGAVESLKGVTLTPGTEYEVVVVSIDERETTEVAKAKRENYLKEWGNPEARNTFAFHTGQQSELKRLADAVGFGYVYDDEMDQFAHGAGIFVLSGEGVLSRTLFGVQYRSGDLKFALIDAANGNVGTIVDRVIMSCFRYYSDNHKYGVYIFGVVRLGGLLTLLLLGTLLFLLWRKERTGKIAMRGPAAH